MKYFILTWGLIALAALLDVIAVIVIKLRLNLLGPIKFDGIYNTFVYSVKIISTPATFLAAVAVTLSPLFYAFALSRINLSIAYPIIIGLSAIFLLIFSYIILNETLTLKSTIGLIFVLIGIFIIYLK